MRLEILYRSGTIEAYNCTKVTAGLNGRTLSASLVNDPVLNIYTTEAVQIWIDGQDDGPLAEMVNGKLKEKELNIL